MNSNDDGVFPNSSAWAATMPRVRSDFAANAPRGSSPASVNQEYAQFAGIDLSVGLNTLRK